jgi:hypothetical protein
LLCNRNFERKTVVHFSIICKGGCLLEVLDFFPLKIGQGGGLLEGGVELEGGIAFEEIRYVKIAY